ncbi:hypothetical protein E8E15_009927 [Penicillium rubens]|nr:hypothetical protein E8E15_009927 [Penicillium rubens]
MPPRIDLDPYKDEILDLISQNTTQAAIRSLLQDKYDIVASRSVLQSSLSKWRATLHTKSRTKKADIQARVKELLPLYNTGDIIRILAADSTPSSERTIRRIRGDLSIKLRLSPEEREQQLTDIKAILIKYGFQPRKIRSDRGTETVLLTDTQYELRKLADPSVQIRDCYLYGRSVDNQRIEGWWGLLSRATTGLFHVSDISSSWKLFMGKLFMGKLFMGKLFMEALHGSSSWKLFMGKLFMGKLFMGKLFIGKLFIGKLFMEALHGS